jgi:hypothetical protein
LSLPYLALATSSNQAVEPVSSDSADEVRNGLTAVRVDLQRAEEKTAEGAARGSAAPALGGAGLSERTPYNYSITR